MKKNIPFFKRFFTYSNEYISGTTYWLRQFLNSILILFFGLGLYFMALTCYKRAKSLGSDNIIAYMAAIFVPVLTLTGQVARSYSILAAFLFLLPHLFLIFKNGKRPNQVKWSNSIYFYNELIYNSNSFLTWDLFQLKTNFLICKSYNHCTYLPQ